MTPPDAGLFAEDVEKAPRTLKPSRKPHASAKFISSIWTFPGQSVDTLYRWYGTLPLGLVERLLDLYAGANARVLDPFMGVGTTLRAAAARGLSATGYDTNPLACLVARTYLAGPPNAEALARGLGLLRPARKSRHETDLAEQFFSDARYSYARKWFREDTLRAVLGLLANISNIPDATTQRLVFVAAAQEIRTVASVDPRCTHHLVTKKKDFIDPAPLVLRRAVEAQNVLAALPKGQSAPETLQASILEAQGQAAQADFVLVHPPYLGVIHYHLIHRLATDLLHFASAVYAPQALADLDFGSESIRRRDASTDDTVTYNAFIGDLQRSLAPLLAPNGVCAVIIGDQRYRGKLRHPFTKFIEAFEAGGLLLEENFIWLLQNNGGMHVLRRGHFIDHNYILVFRRG
jgi:hypothetical protein